MNRAQLEHIIRAAANIADDDEIVIVGSQSILAQHPDAPGELLVSMEADVFPKNHTERADLIDGSIGELSMFHETFGYYAQGVAETTAVLPRTWRDRLIPVRGPATKGATGWCLEIHDLAVSKLVAGREKDLEFLSVAAREHLIDEETLRGRLSETSLDDAIRKVVEARISVLFNRA